MKKQLKEYLNSIFIAAPKTEKNDEIKAEILTELCGRYDECIAEGSTPTEAYRQAIADLGDIDAILSRLEQPWMDNTVRVGLEPESQKEKLKRIRIIMLCSAVALYIISVLPSAIWDADWTAAILFLTVAIATGMIICLPIFDMHTVPDNIDERDRHKLKMEHAVATIMLAASVMGYILCVCFPILFQSWIGICGMLMLVAFSTVLIVFRSITYGESLRKIRSVGEKSDDSESLEEPESEEKSTEKSKKKHFSFSDKIFVLFCSVYWVTVLLVYFAVSFFSDSWIISWVIFPLTALLYGIIHGVYRLAMRKGTAGPIVCICICSFLLFSAIPSAISSYDGSGSIRFGSINAYDDKDFTYGNRSISKVGRIEELNIAWENGPVSITAYEGNTLMIRETTWKGGEAVSKKDEQLRCKYTNGAIDIKEYSPEFGLVASSRTSKKLEIFIPLGVVIEKLDIALVSGSLGLENIRSCTQLNAEVVSGDTVISNCSIAKVNVSGVSGRVDMMGSSIKEVDIDTVSSNVIMEVSGTQHIEINGVSANVTLMLQELTSGFELELTSLASDFACEDFVTEKHGNKYICGGGGQLKVEIGTLSGKVAVEAME